MAVMKAWLIVWILGMGLLGVGIGMFMAFDIGGTFWAAVAVVAVMTGGIFVIKAWVGALSPRGRLGWVDEPLWVPPEEVPKEVENPEDE